MHCLALTLMTIQAWTYAGFLAQPTSPSPPPPTRPAQTVVTPDRLAESKPAVGITPNPAPPAPPPVSPPATGDAPGLGHAVGPTTYRLADASGQVWEHPDPAWLREYVAGRNRLLLGIAR